MMSPACHREPVEELYVSHSRDLSYLAVLEALECGEHILRCWALLPLHGTLVTVLFQDTGAHVKGLFLKRDSDVQERWCEGCVGPFSF